MDDRRPAAQGGGHSGRGGLPNASCPPEPGPGMEIRLGRAHCGVPGARDVPGHCAHPRQDCLHRSRCRQPEHRQAASAVLRRPVLRRAKGLVFQVLHRLAAGRRNPAGLAGAYGCRGTHPGPARPEAGHRPREHDRGDRRGRQHFREDRDVAGRAGIAAAADDLLGRRAPLDAARPPRDDRPQTAGLRAGWARPAG